MSRNKKLIIIAAITALIVIFARAPWLDNQSLHDKIFEERAETDGTIDKYTGEPICDYNVMWIPFGRYIAGCEYDSEIVPFRTYGECQSACGRI